MSSSTSWMDGQPKTLGTTLATLAKFGLIIYVSRVFCTNNKAHFLNVSATMSSQFTQEKNGKNKSRPQLGQWSYRADGSSCMGGAPAR